MPSVHEQFRNKVKLSRASPSDFLITLHSTPRDEGSAHSCWTPDAYDIYYCIRNYPGGPQALANDCKPLLELSEAKQGYAYIASKFDKEDGYGPISVRNFVEETDLLEGRTADQWQTDAFGQAQAWYLLLLVPVLDGVTLHSEKRGD